MAPGNSKLVAPAPAGAEKGDFGRWTDFWVFFSFSLTGKLWRLARLLDGLLCYGGKGLVLLSFDVFCRGDKKGRGDLLGITVGNHYGRGCCGGYGGGCW